MSIVMYRKKIIGKIELAKAVFTYFLVAWPIYLTMLINFMKLKTIKLPFCTISYFEYSIRSNDIVFFAEHPVSQMFSNAWTLFGVAFLQKNDFLWNSIDAFGTMYLCSMPLVIIGIIQVIRQIKHVEKKEVCVGYWSLLLFWIFSILTGIMINSVNVNRINIIFYCNIIFAGIGMTYIIRNFKKAIYILAVVYGILSCLFFNTYFTTWADQISDVFYKEFLDAVEYAEGYECDYYYITPDSQFEGSGNVSEILTMFEMDVDSLYYRGLTDEFNGNAISYSNRFHYENPNSETVNSDSYAAYVIKADDESLFGDAFTIKRFGRYSVAIPKQYVH